MPDETTAALQEIASLLRRRVEQQDEQAERAKQMQASSEERLSKIRDQSDFSKRFEENQHRLDKIHAEQNYRREQQIQEREQREEEEQQFRARLIAELERHNALLERLLARLA